MEREILTISLTDTNSDKCIYSFSLHLSALHSFRWFPLAPIVHQTLSQGRCFWKRYHPLAMDLTVYGSMEPHRQLWHVIHLHERYLQWAMQVQGKKKKNSCLVAKVSWLKRSLLSRQRREGQSTEQVWTEGSASVLWRHGVCWWK